MFEPHCRNPPEAGEDCECGCTIPPTDDVDDATEEGTRPMPPTDPIIPPGGIMLEAAPDLAAGELCDLCMELGGVVWDLGLLAAGGPILSTLEGAGGDADISSSSLVHYFEVN